LVLLLIVILSSLSRIFAQQTSIPEQLLQDARQITDFSSLGSYELHGIITLNPGKFEEIKGEISFLRDHDRSRLDLHIGKYQETRLRLQDKLYVHRTALPPPHVTPLWNFGGAQQILLPPGVTFGKTIPEKVDSADAICFQARGPRMRPQAICVDAEQHFLLRRGSALSGQQFLDYAAVQDRFVPGRIRYLREGQPIAEISGIQLKKITPDARSFSIPTGAAEFSTCNDFQVPEGLALPNPNDNIEAERNGDSGELSALILVDETGLVKHVDLLNSLGKTYDELVVRAFQRWHFSPARCGSKAVAYESEVTVDHRRR